MKPRRSILSVPGHQAKMQAKASKSAADVIMLDLEDSVPLAAKAAARRQVITALQEMDWQTKTLTVRINGLDSAFGYRDLLEVAEAGGERVDAFVVPKVNHPGDIHFVSRMLDGIELARAFSNPIGIEVSIETAAGLARVVEIAATSSRIRALVFGIADYSASVGARLASISGHGETEETLYPGHRWHFALSRIIMAAKAHGLMALDAPFGNFKDPAGLERSAAMASALGCDGKWAIHPDQIEILNRVFSPSIEDIQRAQKVILAAEGALLQGRGAIAVEGRMVDQATVRLARQLYAQAQHLGLV